MKPAGDAPKDERALLARISSARQDRSHFAPLYNKYYDLASPTKCRVDNDTTTPRPVGDQDDIFDATLQRATEDAAADFSNEFTPSYRHWTKHEVVEGVASSSAKKEIQEYIEGRMAFLYDQIRRSSYHQASQEAYHDMLIGPAAMMIRYSQVGEIDCEYVPLAELLLRPGPNGTLSLKARERKVEERFLPVVFPGLDWTKILGKPADDIVDSKTPLKVIEAWERDYTSDREAWSYFLIVKGRVHARGYQKGRGSCPLIVGRVRVSDPSAYGLGPASKAIPSARALNRLKFLELKRIGKIVDPPGVFSDPEGIFNPEQGFENGFWYEIGDGFQMQDMAPQTDIREGIYKSEELVGTIHADLYQDGPEQKGLTPPTAAQWLGMEASKEKRKTLPRARIYSEWVLPVIYRFEWILENRGDLEELQIDGRVVKIEPVSPLSKASDIEEVQIAEQFNQMFVGTFGDMAVATIKVRDTGQAMSAKMGNKLTEFKSDEELQAEQEAQLAAAAMAQGAGAAPGGGSQ